MRPAYQRQFPAHLRQWLPWFLTLLLALLSIVVVRQVLRRYTIIQERQSLEAERDHLQQSNQDLLQLLSYIKSPTYTEEQARLRFGLAKEGERLAVIPPSQTKDSNQPL